MWPQHLVKALPGGFQCGTLHFSNFQLMWFELFLEGCEPIGPNPGHLQQTKGRVPLKSSERNTEFTHRSMARGFLQECGWQATVSLKSLAPAWVVTSLWLYRWHPSPCQLFTVCILELPGTVCHWEMQEQKAGV